MKKSELKKKIKALEESKRVMYEEKMNLNYENLNIDLDICKNILEKYAPTTTEISCNGECGMMYKYISISFTI